MKKATFVILGNEATRPYQSLEDISNEAGCVYNFFAKEDYPICVLYGSLMSLVAFTAKAGYTGYRLICRDVSELQNPKPL